MALEVVRQKSTKGGEMRGVKYLQKGLEVVKDIGSDSALGQSYDGFVNYLAGKATVQVLRGHMQRPQGASTYVTNPDH